MIKLVIFDWNGVLLSDTKACLEADNRVLRRFGGRPVDLQQFRETFVIPLSRFYLKHGCAKNVIACKPEKVAEVFHSVYEARANKCRTRRGARQLLQYCQNHSIKTVILSNHTVQGVTGQLKRLKIESYISDLLANTVLKSSIEARNKLEKAGRYLSLKRYRPGEVMIVGDTVEEVEIGKALGLKTVAITGGYNSNTRLKDSRPDYLINRLTELIKILKERTNKADL